MLSLSSLICLLLCLAMPVSGAFAQSPESDISQNPDSLTEPVDILPPGAVLLGEPEENGVVATAWIYRVPSSEALPTDGQVFPYLLFARFLSAESNIRIEKGLAAYKLATLDEERTPARKMEFKNGYFVAGIEASLNRYSTLHIGCKLEDEKKRQFRYVIKTD